MWTATGERGTVGGVSDLNATAAALLGLLHDGPKTGGQLVAEAGDRFGAFFSVTRSQVSRELPALADQGLLRLGKQGPRSSQQYVLRPRARRPSRTGCCPSLARTTCAAR